MDADKAAVPSTSAIGDVSPTPITLDPAIRPVWPGARLFGTARTARVRAGDNLAIHHAIAAAGAGDVLVVAAEDAPYGHFGEIMATAAIARGVVGLVIDAPVRDVEGLKTLAFPVFARGLAIARTTKLDPGDLDVQVIVGGVSVAPGDVVVADADGIVALPADGAARLLHEARRHEEWAAGLVEQLRAGALTTELLNLPSRPQLA